MSVKLQGTAAHRLTVPLLDTGQCSPHRQCNVQAHTCSFSPDGQLLAYQVASPVGPGSAAVEQRIENVVSGQLLLSALADHPHSLWMRMQPPIWRHDSQAIAQYRLAGGRVGQSETFICAPNIGQPYMAGGHACRMLLTGSQSICKRVRIPLFSASHLVCLSVCLSERSGLQLASGCCYMCRCLELVCSWQAHCLVSR